MDGFACCILCDLFAAGEAVGEDEVFVGCVVYVWEEDVVGDFHRGFVVVFVEAE